MIGALTALAAGGAVALGAGCLLNRRAGTIRATEGPTQTSPDSDGLGLSDSGPTVVHFSATWCGPCAGARRVIDQVCAELGDIAHSEIDLDTDPVAARHLSVLSLPTTFIFDGDGRQRYRVAGVPKAGELRSVLQPLLA